MVQALEAACRRALESETVRAVARSGQQVVRFQSRAEIESVVKEQFRLQGQRIRALGR